MRKILILCIALLIPGLTFAQTRGLLPNVFASWVSVTTTQKTWTLPANSRDVRIINGSSTDICVDLRGSTIPNNCYPGTDAIIQLDGASEIYLDDFVTDAISVRTISGTASPVSVIVTY